MGVTGVHATENERARRWQRHLHLPMLATSSLALLVAFLAIVIQDAFVLRHERLISWLLALIFIAEIAWFLRTVDDRWRYLRQNWLLVAVTIGLVLALLVPPGDTWKDLALLLRFGVAAAIAVQVASGLRGMSPRSAPVLLLIGATALVVCGAMFYAIDPAIRSLGDGMWLSFVTATTVGYGDLVPGSTAARFFAVITVLVGACMMALLTASITAHFLGEEEARQRREMHAEMRQLHREIAQLRQELQRISPAPASPD